MGNLRKHLYPNTFIEERIIEVGGVSKSELIKQLNKFPFCVNEYGDKILMDKRFTSSTLKYTVKTIEITVAQLGLVKGGTLNEIFNRASKLGLKKCPLEIGPYLRLNFLDQPESTKISSHKAPDGSIIIASNVIKNDPDFPKGFYLRNFKGNLWLRGYVSSDDYILNPSDHFIFIK